MVGTYMAAAARPATEGSSPAGCYSRFQHMVWFLQASQIATFADDMAALRQAKADLTQQLLSLQEQHQQLQADHATAVQQLADARLELADNKQ